MLTKTSGVHGGIIALLIITLCSLYYVHWAFQPMNFELAQQNEAMGHVLTKQKKFAEAKKHFLMAAEQSSYSGRKGVRYMFAAITSKDKDEKIKYYKLALEADPGNKKAAQDLAKITGEPIKEKAASPVSKGSFKYFNRYDDGWSAGPAAGADFEMGSEAEYILYFSTLNPAQDNYTVTVSLNEKEIKTLKIVQRNEASLKVTVPAGKSRLTLSIDKTFNPSLLNWSGDNRDLGLLLRIERAGG